MALSAKHVFKGREAKMLLSVYVTWLLVYMGFHEACHGLVTLRQHIQCTASYSKLAILCIYFILDIIYIYD